jgi:hypothetical protein
MKIPPRFRVTVKGGIAMGALLIVCAGLLAASAPAADVLSDYRKAEAAVGRDPDAHVRLALWCEANGLEAERGKHLALAVLHDPSHASARGLMGLVTYGNRWRRPEAVAEKVKSDGALAARLAGYNARRERTPDLADAQWALAVWCDRNDLKPEALAHYTAVTRLDPSRDDAWKRLGCQKHRGRWVRPEQLSAEIAEAEAQRTADLRWHPLLERWRAWSTGPDEGHRTTAEEGLASVSDPRAVASICKAFAKGSPERQALAIRLLKQIQAPASVQALALLAISGLSDAVRGDATETLTRSDPRDFMDVLIGMLHDPIHYEVKPIAGPGSTGVLFVEGEKFNVRRLYEPPPLPRFALRPGDVIERDEFGLPVISRVVGFDLVRSNSDRNIREIHPRDLEIPIGRMVAEAKLSSRVAQKQLQADVAPIERYNTRVEEVNDRVVAVLHKVTGEEFDEPGHYDRWREWWTDQEGYVYKPASSEPKPTVTRYVPLAYQPQTRPYTQTSQAVVGYRRGHACFAAGTPVHTIAGLQPIETLRAGDQVLTQDTTTGALSFQPILAVFHNPPNQTYRVSLGDGAGSAAKPEVNDESIVATGIHRFWKAGKGWAMARDLKPGDTLRTLGGTRHVEAVEGEEVQPVFNLEVAHGHSFFVGDRGILVHDNSLVQPVPEPFDAAPKVATDQRK